MLRLASQPRSIYHILIDSFRWYKKIFHIILPITILLALIIVLPELFVGLPFKGFTIDWSASSILFLAQIAALWVFYVMSYRIYQSILQSQEGYKKAFAVATKKFPLCFIAETFIMILTIIGILLLLLPGIYVSILFIFVSFCILFDNNSLFKAFQYSAQLVQSRWWHVFALFIIILATLFIMTLIFTEIDTLILTAVRVFLRGAFEMNVILQYTPVLTMFLVIVVTIPWAMIVMILQYHDLKLRNQARLTG
jgi:hypothetical protein